MQATHQAGAGQSTSFDLCVRQRSRQETKTIVSRGFLKFVLAPGDGFYFTAASQTLPAFKSQPCHTTRLGNGQAFALGSHVLSGHPPPRKCDTAPERLPSEVGVSVSDQRQTPRAAGTRESNGVSVSLCDLAFTELLFETVGPACVRVWAPSYTE